jgi:hypothetical protein
VSFGGTGLHRLRNLQLRLTRVVTRRDGDHGQGRSRNTVHRGRGQTNILSFSAKPENDQVEVTQGGAVRPWRDNPADD